MRDGDNKFKPYISAGKTLPELTLMSVLAGAILAIVFGAANAYLGLKIGLTVSASIPAAVMAMGIVKLILKKNSILESNIIQTIGSAGESVAAGSIFTVPALFLWAAEGKMNKPSIVEITTIALLGGLLGVLFMIPLRNVLIVKEHNVLPYPEGKACSEVLLAGENGESGSKIVFKGLGVSFIIKFIIDGLKIIPGEITLKFKGYISAIGTQIYPAVISVGYICGPKIASYMFSGGLLSWMFIIPIIAMFGDFSSSMEVSDIWKGYVRYIGAGALAAGGIISLVKTFPIIIETFKQSISSMGGNVSTVTNDRTTTSISIKWVIAGIGIIALLIWLSPAVPITLLGTFLVIIFGFFFATVSSRMVGLVGSSNNPVSGMAIATLLFTTLILKLIGNDGGAGMHTAIAIGSIICIVAAISGDTSQDLKTGFLLGATPKYQQIGEFIGVIASSFTMGATLYLMDKVYGFGSKEIAAPQAMLMKMIVEGVMDNNLPWELVIAGAMLAVLALILQIPILPFAIGIYLPIQLSACVMIGGLIKNYTQKDKEHEGILYCSGLIAGEGLAGVILAVLALIGIDRYIDMSGIVANLAMGDEVLQVGSLLLLLIIVISIKRIK